MLVDELRALFLFDGVSDRDLAALAAAGQELVFAPGEVLFQQGGRAEAWWVLLEGRVELLRRAGREETVVATMASPGQWAGGFTAWDDEGGYMATGRGATSGRMLRVSGDELGRWARAVFPLGVHLITGVFQTVRHIEAMAGQREALVALGTLAAGLAHEINNPAAATARAVDSLQEVCDAMLASLASLGRGSLTASQFIELDALRRSLADQSASITTSLIDREEALTEWLEARDVADAWRIAPALAESGADTAWCEQVAAVLPGATLGPGLEWVTSTLAASAILGEMREATARVSALVAAVKSYSALDRAAVQLIDVTDGLESTLVMLAHRLRGGITVEREYAAELPRIEANPGQLNQVWTNLLDNAIDATDGSGTVRLRAFGHDDGVIVEVIDDGPGMTPEVQAHAFEPFFTTKDVGKGTGLGLDISRRIVHEQHGGEITIASGPGRTVIRVQLPASRSGEDRRS